MNHSANYHKYLKYIVIFVIIWLGVWFFKGHKKPTVHTRDFTAIKTSGIIHIATEYNKLSFYADSDTISGFDYELIKAFAHDMKLRIDIHPVMSEDERLKGLSDGTFDLIACNLQATSEMKDSLLLTSPIVLTRQVLVQRKAGIGKVPYIKSQLDLARKTLNVPKDSPCILRIRHLSNEIGDTIYIKEIKKYGSEQLMYMVAHGDINYAVCDENIARAYAPHLPNIDIHTAISFTQFYSWGVSKKSPALRDSLNVWLSRYKGSAEYKRIYLKYMEKNNNSKNNHER